ncbi:signal recognition particle, 68 kDa subunit [Mariannaea sp. PMI_226]|nr:signal recognition particle, 68 kDa subunit [Mariannaea sp. PMI_226]
MDITNFIVKTREQSLLYGDYAIYHSRLSKKLLNYRKKLGIATKNRGKFHPKTEITPEEIAQNQGYVHLLILTSERAWAQALKEKSQHSSSKRGITGKARSHIISRLTKATRAADNLVDALSQSDVSGASSIDILESKAYAALIRGAMLFEKQNWKECLPCYASSRIIYTALASIINSRDDIFKELLKETIDPSIRIAAYQLESTRSVPIPLIAQRAFPKSDTALVEEINKIDPSILQEGEEAKEGASGAKAAPKTLTWRSREVPLEDVDIAVAWGEVMDARERLVLNFADAKGKQPQELSSAYDEILLAAQEAVDATKKAIDEMRAEGIDQADPRMQKLQIIRTAVNFEMISWRIGRNRVLTGNYDGATEEYGPLRRRKAKADEQPTKHDKDLPAGKKLSKLREKAALYSGILQSTDSIKELPGVANDQELAAQIESFAKYFEALNTLSIARSHAIIDKPTNALALIHHAFKLSQESLSNISKSQEATRQGPLDLRVAPEAIQFLHRLLQGERERYRAIVYIDDLRDDKKKDDAEYGVKRPLVETLNEYPINGADLTNIVEYPPKMALIPMKPIFLDIAWNYIDYPGKAAQAPPAPVEEAAAAPAPQQPVKRGWFGFGR